MDEHKKSKKGEMELFRSRSHVGTERKALGTKGQE